MQLMSDLVNFRGKETIAISVEDFESGLLFQPDGDSWCIAVTVEPTPTSFAGICIGAGGGVTAKLAQGVSDFIGVHQISEMVVALCRDDEHSHMGILADTASISNRLMPTLLGTEPILDIVSMDYNPFEKDKGKTTYHERKRSLRFLGKNGYS